MNEIDEFQWIEGYNQLSYENFAIVYKFLQQWNRPLVVEEFEYWFVPNSEGAILQFLADVMISERCTLDDRKIALSHLVHSTAAMPPKVFAVIHESKIECDRAMELVSHLRFKLQYLQRHSRTYKGIKND